MIQLFCIIFKTFVQKTLFLTQMLVISLFLKNKEYIKIFLRNKAMFLEISFH
jgi:hypothetical protein